MTFGYILIFCTTIIWVSPSPLFDVHGKCGYESCHPIKEGFINVHIVPHTHDDVGWLKTVDQYYYGSRTNIQNAGVQYILDSVIEALKKDSTRRFIYVETAFFWKWWIKQDNSIKELVQNFVQNGQLEFIGGAWSMNDEATTHYQSIIDQFSWGLRKLNNTFGECGRPKIGWQIDPFGHSREMASIFSQLGFDGLLLGRIDYQEKMKRFETKTPEMIWRGSNNLGDKSNIFTGVMYNVYAPPKGFCFDILCTDDPIIDDINSADYNVPEKIDDFFAYLKNVSDAYATNNLIITMGEDFNYQEANTWFQNLDLLIKYGNELQANGSKYNLIYSTPSCYVKAIYDETKGKSKWFVKDDDFFPYASDPHAFWTGYFTSRPTVKRFERDGNNFLQVCKQLAAITNRNDNNENLNELREAMGVMQHHDAVTGTEKEHVAHDYARILHKSFEKCGITTSTALSHLMSKSQVEIPFQSCLLANISSCPTSENEERFLVTVYNPLSRPVNKNVRLPVLDSAYTIQDSTGKLLPLQIVPIPTPVLNIPGRNSKATSELVFVADEVPPLGFKSFYVSRTETFINYQESSQKNQSSNNELEFDEVTGFLKSVTINDVKLSISQDFLYYQGFVGDNKEFVNRSSGAYIFRPLENSAKKVTEKVKVKKYEGNIVTEFHQIFNEWISQVIRIYKNENYFELEWLVGPIPADETYGKEIITRFKTDLKSDSTFYTDSNGRELIKRVRDFRPTWTLDLEEPVAGNYYPVTSKILIRDDKEDIELAILNDRAQGGSSLKDGQIELMVHRNCLHDDAFGVGESLIETAYDKGLVVRGTQWLVFGKISRNISEHSIAAIERDLAQKKLLNTWTFIAPTNKSFNETLSSYNFDFAGLNRTLPQNVQILTLEPWGENRYLLRLEHVLEKNEDASLSLPVTVDLKDLFNTFDITSIKESTLGGNQWLKDNHRLIFEEGTNIKSAIDTAGLPLNVIELRRKYDTKSFETANTVKRASVEENLSTLKIDLEPMQIRTFVVNVVPK